MGDSVTGWWNPAPFTLRSKFHYVGKDGRTLCGKWLYVGRGTVEEGQDGHDENCAACKRKRAKQQPEPSGKEEE